MKLKLQILAVTLLMGSFTLVLGQTPAPTPSPFMEVAGVDVYKTKGEWCTVKPNHPCEAGLGDRVIVYVDGLKAAVNREKDPINPRELVLYLDQRELGDLKAVPYGNNQLAFDLKRTDASSPVWSALLARPGLKNLRENTKVSIGFPNKQAMPAVSGAQINLRLYYRGWAIAALIGLALTLGLFYWLANRTGIIRDSGPTQLNAVKRPYSLARTQAAFWFWVVIGSFVFLYMLTGDYNTISDQALILMGLGTGTALGAAMIDANKKDKANESLLQLTPERAQLEAKVEGLKKQIGEISSDPNATAEKKQALIELNVELKQKEAVLAEKIKSISDASSGLEQPASEGFFKDLLTDVNGINLHRFQMVIWTAVLGVLFVIGVHATLVMPTFSATLLALMGISSGVYLGFKIPEQQT